MMTAEFEVNVLMCAHVIVLAKLQGQHVDI